jgi:Na+/H+ antiporter NhaD/arsenite permease-like protein
VVREGKAVGKGNLAEAEYVAEIESKYVITNKPLLIKSGIVLGVVVAVFFLEAFVELHLSLAWTSLIGAVVLLILADVHDINTVFEKVFTSSRMRGLCAQTDRWVYDANTVLSALV